MRDGSTLNDFMQWDNTLFDGIILNPEISRETLVSTIMFKCGLRNPLYEHYDVFKSQVHTWFAAHEWNFDKLVDLIKSEYNPLWNKEYFEERDIDTTKDETENIDRDIAMQMGGENTTTEGIDETGSETHSGADVRNISGTTSETGTATTSETGNRTNNRTDTHSVKGFNASDWQETDRTVSNETENTTKDGTENTTKNGTETTEDRLTHGETINHTKEIGRNETEAFGQTQTTDDVTARTAGETGTQKEKYKGWGNIGVMSSQQLFLAQTDLLKGFNLYEYITEMFDNDLMIGVFS